MRFFLLVIPLASYFLHWVRIIFGIFYGNLGSTGVLVQVYPNTVTTWKRQTLYSQVDTNISKIYESIPARKGISHMTFVANTLKKQIELTSSEIKSEAPINPHLSSVQ